VRHLADGCFSQRSGCATVRAQVLRCRAGCSPRAKATNSFAFVLRVGDTAGMFQDGNATAGSVWERPSEEEDTAALTQMGRLGFQSTTGLIWSRAGVSLRLEAAARHRTELPLIRNRSFERE